jgi:hypothetical protein
MTSDCPGESPGSSVLFFQPSLLDRIFHVPNGLIAENNCMKRREFLKRGVLTGAGLASGSSLLGCSKTHTDQKQDSLPQGYVSLFDGKTLHGWHTAPRLPVPRYPGGPKPDTTRSYYKRALTTHGKWTVEEGVIIGGQDPPGCGLGGYLVSDGTYGDFELLIDARPDWPVDTGILVRATSTGTRGFQVHIDHRKSGGIGGFYGNGLAGFRVEPYCLDVERDEKGHPVGLVSDRSPLAKTTVTAAECDALVYAAPVESLLDAWKWADWNTFKIRCEGKHPYMTTWINGVKICELDSARIDHPDYDKNAVANMLGREGHISLEVHDNDSGLGKGRWWPGAVCRWRNIYLKKRT